MQLAAAQEPKLPHLHPKFLEDVYRSCLLKCSKEQYEYILITVEGTVDIVTKSMMNANDYGFGFLKLAIHPGSSPSSMAVIYEKVINQTPWKYRKTALAFVEAIDTLFKFATKNPEVLATFESDGYADGDKTKLLEALSEFTIMYIARLCGQESERKDKETLFL